MVGGGGYKQARKIDPTGQKGIRRDEYSAETLDETGPMSIRLGSISLVSRSGTSESRSKPAFAWLASEAKVCAGIWGEWRDQQSPISPGFIRTSLTFLAFPYPCYTLIYRPEELVAVA